MYRNNFTVKPSCLEKRRFSKNKKKKTAKHWSEFSFKDRNERIIDPRDCQTRPACDSVLTSNWGKYGEQRRKLSRGWDEFHVEPRAVLRPTLWVSMKRLRWAVRLRWSRTCLKYTVQTHSSSTPLRWKGKRGGKKERWKKTGANLKMPKHREVKGSSK